MRSLTNHRRATFKPVAIHVGHAPPVLFTPVQNRLRCTPRLAFFFQFHWLQRICVQICDWQKFKRPDLMHRNLRCWRLAI